MPYIHLVNPEERKLLCAFGWGKLLGKEKCSCHFGQDQYEHECLKRKGHFGRHLCGNCGQKTGRK